MNEQPKREAWEDEFVKVFGMPEADDADLAGVTLIIQADRNDPNHPLRAALSTQQAELERVNNLLLAGAATLEEKEKTILQNAEDWRLLRADLERMKGANRLLDAAVKRHLPCPDHRDKVSVPENGCPYCALTRKESELAENAHALLDSSRELRRVIEERDLATSELAAVREELVTLTKAAGDTRVKLTAAAASLTAIASEYRGEGRKLILKLADALLK